MKTLSSQLRVSFPSRLKSSVVFTSLLVLIAAAGAFILAIASSTWGLGLSTDSIEYVSLGRQLIAGRGYTLGFDGMKPVTQWPPLFPLSLAAFGFFNVDSLDAGRILNVTLFGMNTALFGIFLRRYAGSTAAIAGSVLFVLSPVILELHSNIYSEPLFIFLVFLSIFFLIEYIAEAARPVFFALSACLMALACMTRYAGISFAAGACFILLLLSGRTFAVRLMRAVFYGMISVSPLGFWLLRNKLLGDNITNRSLDFHPPTGEHFSDALRTLCRWLMPAGAPGLLSQGVLVLFLAAVLSAAGFFLFRFFKTAPASLSANDRRLFRFIPSMIILVFAYCLLIAGYITFNSTNMPMNNRLLSPVYVAGALSALVLFGRAVKISGLPGVLRWIAFFAMTLVAAHYMQSSVKDLIKLHKKGLKFASRAVQTSRTLASAQLLPPDAEIYSNGPELVYLWGRRSSTAIPKMYSRSHQRKGAAAEVRESYQKKMKKMKKTLLSKEMYYVYLTARQRWFHPTLQDIQKEFSLSQVDAYADGAVYQLNLL